MTKILIGIIIVLTLILCIMFPIGFSKIEKMNKLLVAKDVQISSLKENNKQLMSRLELIQKINDEYNKSISKVNNQTLIYLKDDSSNITEENLKTKPDDTTNSINKQFNDIFTEMGTIGVTK